MRSELTLAIPVYNSPNKHRATLLSLSEFLGDEGTEILVSDNHSSDHIQAVISEFSQSQTNLNYTEIDRNIGYRGNVKSLENSSGEWVWPISSGDRVVLEDCQW